MTLFIHKISVAPFSFRCLYFPHTGNFFPAYHAKVRIAFYLLLAEMLASLVRLFLVVCMWVAQYQYRPTIRFDRGFWNTKKPKGRNL